MTTLSSLIERNQRRLPHHFRGFPHNATDEFTRRVQVALTEITEFFVSDGDIWVNISETQMRFGYLTRQSEMAIHRLIEFQHGTIMDEFRRLINEGAKSDS